jgi:hypothetical protein
VEEKENQLREAEERHSGVKKNKIDGERWLGTFWCN